MSKTLEEPRLAGATGDTGADGSADTTRSRNGTSAKRRWLTRLILAVVAVLVLVLVAAWALLYSPWFTTTSLRFTGLGPLSEADVRAAAAIPEGEPLLTLDTGAAAARVESLPGVERAEVTRSWPHTAAVQVVPRSAVAIATSDAGLDLVDRFGVRFASTPDLPTDQPVLVAGDGDPMKAAVTVAAALPPQLREQVEAIVVTGDQVRLRLREPGENSDSSGQTSSGGSGSDSGKPLDISKFTRWQLSDGNLVRMVNWGTADRSELKAKVLAAMLSSKGTLAGSSDGSTSSDGQEISFRWFDVSTPDFPTAGATAPKSVVDELTSSGTADQSQTQAGGSDQGGQGSGQASQDGSQGSSSGSGQGSQGTSQSTSGGSSQNGQGGSDTGSGSSGSAGTSGATADGTQR